MKWVRQYRRHSSSASHIVKRMKRREDMAKKRSMKGKDAPKKRAGISPQQYFHLRDGTAIKSIEELALRLDNISDEDFTFHVNEEKNDFSNWIKDVFDQAELADCLCQVKGKKESQICLLKHAVEKKRR